MQVCIAGWYYMNECLAPFSTIPSVHIVAHRPGNALSIPCIIIENVGLEFNCYDYFVKNIWDKKSDVLFCHDDIKIKDISFLDDLEKMKDAIIMVWCSENQYKRNLAHGRVFKCSAEYLTDKGGFWWDTTNTGCTNASKGCNRGIERLYQSTKKIMKHFYTNKIEMGKRGQF